MFWTVRFQNRPVHNRQPSYWVWYEHGLIWTGLLRTGLLWTWSLLNGHRSGQLLRHNCFFHWKSPRLQPVEQCFWSGFRRNRLKVWGEIRNHNSMRLLLGSLHRVPCAMQSFAESSVAAKRLKNTAVDADEIANFAQHPRSLGTAPSGVFKRRRARHLPRAPLEMLRV